MDGPLHELSSKNVCDLLNLYMKSRNISRNKLSKDAKPDTSVSEKVKRSKSSKTDEDYYLWSVISNKTSKSNAVYFTADSDVNYDSQFNSFNHYISKSPENVQAELGKLCFPLFIHMFLTLLQTKNRVMAIKFFKKYCSLFIKEKQSNALIQEAANLKSYGDIETSINLCLLRNNITEVWLSEECLDNLITYLESSGSKSILEILNKHFEIHVNDDPDIIDVTEFCMSENKRVENDNLNSQKTFNISTLELLETIKNFEAEKPVPPQICEFSITIEDDIVEAADISDRELKIAAGCSNSKVYLFDSNLCHLEEDSLFHAKIAPESCVLLGHSSSVTCLKFISEFQLLTSSEDTTVRLWDLNARENVFLYKGHNYPVWCIDVFRQQNYFATSSMDYSIRLWSFEKIHPLRSMFGHQLSVQVVRFHPNGNYIASGSLDKTVRLWSLQEGSLVRVFHGHEAGVTSLEFSRDGKFLISAGTDNQIKLWDLAEGKLLSSTSGDFGSVQSICVDTFMQFVLAACQNGRLNYWNYESIIRDGKWPEGDHFTYESRLPLLVKQSCRNPSAMLLLGIK